MVCMSVLLGHKKLNTALIFLLLTAGVALVVISLTLSKSERTADTKPSMSVGEIEAFLPIDSKFKIPLYPNSTDVREVQPRYKQTYRSAEYTASATITDIAVFYDSHMPILGWSAGLVSEDSSDPSSSFSQSLSFSSDGPGSDAQFGDDVNIILTKINDASIHVFVDVTRIPNISQLPEPLRASADSTFAEVHVEGADLVKILYTDVPANEVYSYYETLLPTQGWLSIETDTLTGGIHAWFAQGGAARSVYGDLYILAAAEKSGNTRVELRVTGNPKP